MDGYKIIHYVTLAGKVPFQQWLQDLWDMEAKVSIVKRLNRLEQGNLGDYKPCRAGTWELRFGNGYRVYYAQVELRTLLLLCGGHKRSQGDDIARAVLYWKEWQRRNKHETLT